MVNNQFLLNKSWVIKLIGYNFVPIYFWGALIHRAEIIPFEPDPGSTGEGKELTTIPVLFPPFWLLNRIIGL